MDDYFTEIEAHFALRRGTPFILSAKDWALMKSWRESGVPLPVVIEAIDSVFEKNETSGRRKAISSLSYCRHAVKELWQERRELVVGEGGSPETDGAAETLKALAAQLDDSANAVARTFGARVRELASEGSVPRLEEGLIRLERELIDAIVGTLPDTEREELNRSIALAIGATRLDPKTRTRTEEANLRRAVRERFQLPRLTLFH